MKRIFSLFFLLSASAMALDDNAVIKKLDPAWVSLEQKAVSLAGPDYQRLMVDAAFASVAVSACSGLSFNGDEVNARFTQMVNEKGGKTPEDQQNFSVKASVLYGTYLGLLIAESHLDTPVFCKYVEKAKARNGGPNQFWISK